MNYEYRTISYGEARSVSEALDLALEVVKGDNGTLVQGFPKFVKEGTKAGTRGNTYDFGQVVVVYMIGS